MIGLEFFAQVIKNQDPSSTPYNCLNNYLNGTDFVK